VIRPVDRPTDRHLAIGGGGEGRGGNRLIAVNIRPPAAAEKRAVRVQRLPSSDWLLLLLLLMRAVRWKKSIEKGEAQRKWMKFSPATDETYHQKRKKNTKTTTDIVLLAVGMRQCKDRLRRNRGQFTSAFSIKITVGQVVTLLT
jgi:hypothetical protein